MTDTIILFIFDAIIVFSKEFMNSRDSINVRERTQKKHLYS